MTSGKRYRCVLARMGPGIYKCLFSPRGAGKKIMSSTTQVPLTARPVGALACQMNSYRRSLLTRVVSCTAAATAIAPAGPSSASAAAKSSPSAASPFYYSADAATVAPPACSDLQFRTIASYDKRQTHLAFWPVRGPVYVNIILSTSPI